MKISSFFKILVFFILIISCNKDKLEVELTGLSLTKLTTQIEVGDTEQLFTVISPENAQPVLIWKSNNEEVVEVSSAGIIVAKKVGITTVEVSSQNNKEAYITVEVVANNNGQLTSISLNKTSTQIIKGESEQITATISPQNASETLQWNSNNMDVAEVNTVGLITAKKTGAAIITVISSNNITASISVTVVLPEPVGSWTSMDVPSSELKRFGGIQFVIGNKAYVGLGTNSQYSYNGGTSTSNGGYKSDFWVYDTLTNIWTQLSNFPGDSRFGAVSFSIGTNGYIGLGSNQNGLKNDFWKYNPSTDSWTQLNNFPGSPRTEATGNSVGNEAYVGLGNTSSTYPYVMVNDFWKYNPITDSWTQLNNFPGAARYSATSFIINNDLYIGMGGGGGGYLNDCWKYSTISNTWNQVSSLIDGVLNLSNNSPGQYGRERAAGFSLFNKGYVGLGYVDYFVGGNRSDFWQYNPIEDTWLPVSDFPHASYSSVVFSTENKAFVGFGTQYYSCGIHCYYSQLISGFYQFQL